MLIFKKRINSNQWYDIILIEWSVILFVLLPSISSSELMQGTMTGKLFFFMCMLLIGYLFISLKFIFRLPPSVSFNHVDGLLFTWVTYIFINGWYHHIPVTNRLLEFRGLILLYILLRQIKPSKYSIVLMAMILGGTIQAIYGNLYADDTTGNFPRENALVLSESRRFDSSISSLANTVALSKAQMDGTDNEFTQKGIKHTIFLFEKENAAQVIDEFGQLILDTFSDEELKTYEKEGVHVIGMIHDKKEETKDNQFPKGIYDYWNAYEARKANKRTTPKNLIDYLL